MSSPPFNIGSLVTNSSGIAIGALPPNKIWEIGTSNTGMTINGPLHVQGDLQVDGITEYRGLRFAVREIVNGFIVQHAKGPGEAPKEYYCSDLAAVGARVAACCAEEQMK